MLKPGKSYTRGGEPIYYHGPHELWIIAGVAKSLNFFLLKFTLIYLWGRATSLDLLSIDINCKYLLTMELRFNSLLYTRTWVTKILMRTISNVHAGRIWPTGSRFPTPVLYQPSLCFFQELKTTRLTEYFASVNLIFKQYISTAVFLQRNESN